MRFDVVKALLLKEYRRHLANRGGLLLFGVLALVAVALALADPVELLRPTGLKVPEGAPAVKTVAATGIILFALFLACVYLLPGLTCEEHERGQLLAQMLTPVWPGELLLAKCLFYPALGGALAALVAGVQQPVALLNPLFWLVLALLAAGAMGVGLTISSLARTQRAASLGAMCYLMASSLTLLALQQSRFDALANLFLEFHGPRLLFSVLTDRPAPLNHFAWAVVLSAGWLTAAWVTFRRYGWR